MSLDIISADDHIIEPPDLWADRLPAKYREAGPRVIWDTDADGKRYQTWVYQGRQVISSRLNAAASFTRDEYSFEPMSYDDLMPGCYDPLERIKHMDQDGCLASLCFPTFPRLCGQTFLEGADFDLGLRCVQAWNDWNLEEWAGAAPGRLIPMSIVPLWDPQLAAAEVHRVAALGSRAISFSENPNALGQPSIHDPDGYWDPLMQALVEVDLPMCLHIGSSSRMVFERGEVPPTVEVGLAPFNAQVATFNWCFSELLDRFQTLSIVLSEGGIGWIPYALERMDFTFDHQGSWTNASKLSRKPSETFRQQFYGCFIDDQFGAEHVVQLLGADRCLLEVDYPHSDTTWPNTQSIAAEHLAALQGDDLYNITRGNAERIFNFTPSAVGAL